MNIFVRYADIAGYPPMPYRVRAYDCRFFFILSGSGKIEIDGTEYRFAPEHPLLLPGRQRLHDNSGETAALRIGQFRFHKGAYRHPLRHAACSRGKLRKKAAA